MTLGSMKQVSDVLADGGEPFAAAAPVKGAGLRKNSGEDLPCPEAPLKIPLKRVEATAEKGARAREKKKKKALEGDEVQLLKKKITRQSFGYTVEMNEK